MSIIHTFILNNNINQQNHSTGTCMKNHNTSYAFPSNWIKGSLSINY